MDNHSVDPNQTYLARIRKFIHFTVRIQKTLKNCKSQKNYFFFRFRIHIKTNDAWTNSYFLKHLRYADPKIFFPTRIRTILTRIRKYFIQNTRIRSPALVQIMKRYLKNLEEWLLLLHTVRYLIKNARIRIYSYGTRSTLWYRNQFISFKKLNKRYLRQKS